MSRVVARAVQAIVLAVFGTFSSGRTVAQRRILRAMRALIPTAVAASLVAVPSCTQDAPAAEQDRPNVVVIMVDDARVDDLGALPQTRDLIGHREGLGATYANAYDSLPLCCPARATFLSGQYAHNHGVWDNMGDHGGFDAFDDTDTLPLWMQTAGYQTVMLGKYFNGYGVDDPTYVPPGWDSWAGVVGNLSQWTNYHDFTINRNGTLVDVQDGYQTTEFTGRALSQLDQRIPSDDPLFMWLSFLAPHDDSNHHVPAQPKYAGMSTIGQPDSEAFSEPAVGDKPVWIRDRPLLTEDEIDAVVQIRRERRDALRTVDDSVVKIVDRLTDLGELDDTVLMFVSDNGYLLGEHRLTFGKRYPYEESISIPFMMRGPGVTPGLHEEPIVNVDLPSTIIDLADATPGHPVDGLSLLNPSPVDRPILIESPKAYVALPAYSGLRTPESLYIEYADGTVELYDMVNDPDQRVNRAASAGLRSAKRGLALKLDQLRDCVGAECR